MYFSHLRVVDYLGCLCFRLRIKWLESRGQVGFASAAHVSIWGPGRRSNEYLCMLFSAPSQEHKKTKLTGTCKASACISSTQISLNKANHTVKPKVREVRKYTKYTSPQLGERREWIFAKQKFNFLFNRCGLTSLKLLGDYISSKCLEMSALK